MKTPQLPAKPIKASMAFMTTTPTTTRLRIEDPAPPRKASPFVWRPGNKRMTRE